MGGALLDGILSTGIFAAKDMCVIERDHARRREIEERYGVLTPDDYACVPSASLVIIAVKPQSLKDVVRELSDTEIGDLLLISIVAGAPIRYYANALPSVTRIARVMPNTPAQIGHGVSAVSYSEGCTSQDKALVESLFAAVGSIVAIPEELQDAATAISGSGPAYLFLFAEALIDAGRAAGLPSDTARTLVLKMLEGAIALTGRADMSLSELREAVTSPGGTTERGIGVFVDRQFAGIVTDAVTAAADRADELRQIMEGE